MSAYDYIIQKFILKSKTKWVDGLQFVLLFVLDYRANLEWLNSRN